MITIKQVFALLLLIFILQSCDVTFPKETLIEDTQAFIKKETQVDTSVYVYGTTLYLDVVFEDLTTNDSNKIIDIYKKLQDIVSAITRVPLSSNKDINIVVISAFDSQYKVLLRIFVNIDDIKKVSHSYISRTDYFERQLMEFETEELAKQAIENKYDISLEEYIARLSISRTTNSSLGKKPNFNDIQDNCEIDPDWKTQYKLACFVNHGSPQGTFKRLANGLGTNCIPVGHSNYGIAMPAVQSAISLVWISHLFLSLFPTVEYLSRVLLMQDWLDFLREQYEETEKQLFGELDGNTNENK